MLNVFNHSNNTPNPQKLLEVENLKVSVPTQKGRVEAVHNASFSIGEKELFALVGESGSGKTLTASAIIGLFNSEQVRIESGTIRYRDQDITRLPSDERRKLLGKEISYIPQNPLSSLNPTLTIGYQIIEAIYEGAKLSKKDREALAIEMLRLVGFSEHEKRLHSFPHELSGGMRQRVLIAIALINKPKLIIADEPTTALDVTIQAQILDVLKNLQNRFSTSMLFITHDMGIVAQIADKVAVMYAGDIIENGTTNEIFYSPLHPYTKALIQCTPRIDEPQTFTSIPGTPPSLGKYNTKCPFFTRCQYAMQICSKHEAPLFEKSHTHSVRCFLMSFMDSNGNIGNKIPTRDDSI